MSILPRKDIECPFCQVFPPFTIKANGVKIERRHYSIASAAGAPILSTCLRPWEVELLCHMNLKHRDRWRELMDSLAVVPSPAGT